MNRIRILLILSVAAAFRLLGLANRVPSLDEMHYRYEMARAKEMIESGAFRNHSVRHAYGSAPHGMLAPLMSLVTGRVALAALAPILPRRDYGRDNFLSRLFPALCGVFLVGIGYLLARVLFSDSTAEWVALLLALSPIQVNWSRSEYLDVAMTLFAALSFLFAMWPKLEARRSSGRELAALSGLCAGLALACKWSAIVLIPFPLAVLLLVQRGSGESSSRPQLLSGATFCLFAALASCWFLSLDSFRWAYSPPAGAPYGVPSFPRTPFAVVQGLSSIPLAELQTQAVGFTLNWAGPLFPLLLAGLWLTQRPARSRTVEVVRSDRRKGTLPILLASIPAFVLVQGGELNTWRAFYPVFVCLLASGHLFDRLDRRKRFRLGVMVAVTVIPFTLSYGLRVGPNLTSYFGSELRYSPQLPSEPPMRWVATPDGKEALIPTNFIFQRRGN